MIIATRFSGKVEVCPRVRLMKIVFAKRNETLMTEVAYGSQ